jgi:hypothetical protein
MSGIVRLAILLPLVCACPADPAGLVLDSNLTVDARPDGAKIPVPDSGACGLFGPLLERRTLIPGEKQLEDIYASTVLHDGKGHMMWYSGWRKASDFPHDKIFFASSSDGLDWKSPSTPALVVQGAVADPSVIFHSPSGTYIMLFSYIKDPAKWHGLKPENYKLDADENYLRVWIAKSKDGVTWTDARELIGRDNGVDDTGAWAPSILQVDATTAHVYYNNDPNFIVHPAHQYRVFRSTLDLSGGSAKVVETVAVVSDGKLRANVDVSRDEDGYLMLYNEILAGPVQRWRVAAMASKDGLDWQEVDPTPLRPAGTEKLDIATPHLFLSPKHPGETWIFVGEGDQSQLKSSVTMWRFTSCR